MCLDANGWYSCLTATHAQINEGCLVHKTQALEAANSKASLLFLSMHLDSWQIARLGNKYCDVYLCIFLQVPSRPKLHSAQGSKPRVDWFWLLEKAAHQGARSG